MDKIAHHKNRTKEQILEDLASEYSTDFDTVMIWGGKELRQLILDAMDDNATQSELVLQVKIDKLQHEKSLLIEDLKEAMLILNNCKY